MWHQQSQIEQVLEQRGWHVVERRKYAANWWFDEVWVIESVWSPVGRQAYISYVVDRHVAEKDRQPGAHVASVAVSRVEPTEMSFGPEVFLRPAWEKRGLAEFGALIDGLRDERS
jgi:hypothetical protein